MQFNLVNNEEQEAFFVGVISVFVVSLWWREWLASFRVLTVAYQGILSVGTLLWYQRVFSAAQGCAACFFLVHGIVLVGCLFVAHYFFTEIRVSVWLVPHSEFSVGVGSLWLGCGQCPPFVWLYILGSKHWVCFSWAPNLHFCDECC